MQILFQTKRMDVYPLSEIWSSQIFKNNTGNVKKYFFDFSNLEQAKKWVEATMLEIAKDKKIEYVLVKSQTNNLIGMVSIRIYGMEADVGLWVAEAEQQKGYAKEALESIIDQLKMDHKTTRVYYLAESDNQTSIKLAKSLGFKTLNMKVQDNILHTSFIKEL